MSEKKTSIRITLDPDVSAEVEAVIARGVLESKVREAVTKRVNAYLKGDITEIVLKDVFSPDGDPVPAQPGLGPAPAYAKLENVEVTGK